MNKPLPPGRFGLPVLGETLSFAKNPFAFVEDRIARYGPIFRTSLLGRKAVFFSGPDAADAFVDPKNCKRAGALPPAIRSLFGGVAVNSMDGDEHANHKRAVMAGFSRGALESYLPTLEALVSEQLRAWSQSGAQPLSAGMQRIAVEGICATVLGIDGAETIADFIRDYDLVARGLGSIPVNLPFTTYGKANKAVSRCVKTLRAEVERRRGAPTEAGLSRILAFQNPDGTQLTDEGAARELHHVVAAGFIVYALLNAIVIRLTDNPGVSDRLGEEIAANAAGGALTLGALRDMPQLEQFCLEVKRVTPVVPFALGLAARTFEVGGYSVPEGWMLGHVIPASMMAYGVFSDPDRFDPDRFSPERMEHERHEHAIVAQGAGEYFGRGHLCAGVDFSSVLMKVFTIHLLREYTWELPAQDLRLDMARIPPSPRSALVATIQSRAA